MKSNRQQVNLDICHGFIVSDFEKDAFLSEHTVAPHLLTGADCDTPRTFLHALNVIKGLAKIIVAKPHSGDVERLISECKTPHTSDSNEERE